jgi:hypothetical protein
LTAGVISASISGGIIVFGMHTLSQKQQPRV